MIAEERHRAPGARVFRRSLNAARAITLATATTTTGQASAAKLAARYHVEAAALNARDDLTPETEGPAWEAVNALYEAACDAPVSSKADAAAKVRLAIVSLQEGERADHRDIAALEQVIYWLEAN